MNARLPLHDEVTLLTLHPDRGTPPLLNLHAFALAGAALAELALAGAVALDADRRRPRLVAPARSSGVRDPVLRDLIRRVRADRPRTPARWIARLSRGSRLRHDTARGLCRRGVLRAVEASFLLLFRRRVYPTLDPGPRRRAVEELRRAIACDDPPTPRDAALAGLACSSGLHRRVLERRELKGRRARMRALGRGELVEEASTPGATVAAVVRAAARAAAAAQNAAAGA